MQREKTTATRPSLLEDLFRAYFDARKNKRNTKNQLTFEFNLERNLVELYNEIKDRTYRPGPSICFIISKPVKREIFTSQFRDHVVHRLLFNYLLPVFEKTTIYDSYACFKGRGTSFGINRLDQHIKACTKNYTCDAYVLKLDLQGYFVNINKEILYGILCDGLEKYWNTPDGDGLKGDGMDRDLILFLVDVVLSKEQSEDFILCGSPKEGADIPASKRLSKSPKGVGLALGDVSSQLFSNIYMGIFDNHIKHELKIKHYGRYVDDFYFVHQSKTYLLQMIRYCKEWLENNLGISVHPNKIYLQHYTKGVKFLGAVVKPNRRYVDNKSVKEFRATVKQIEKICRQKNVSKATLFKCRSQLNSYCGYFSQFKTYRIMDKVFKHSKLDEHFVFEEGYRKVMLHPKYNLSILAKTDKKENLDNILSM